MKRFDGRGVAKSTIVLGIIVVVVVAGVGAYLATRPPVKPVGKIYLLCTPRGRGDLSFIDMSYKGAEDAARDFGFEVADIVFEDPAEMVSALRMAAEDPEARLIVGTSFYWNEPIDEVAPDYPEDNFLIIDIGAVKPLPNVLGVVYEQHKGSALVGALGALLAIHYDKPHIGAVFGHPISVLWNFEIGYKWGCDWAVSWYENNFPDEFAAEPESSIVNTARDKRVLYEYIYSWSDTTKAEMAAKTMFDAGAVAVYNVCGGAGMGIFSAVDKIAAEQGLEMGPPFGIGVDANQDWISPGFIIASMLKRVDLSVYHAAKWVHEGKFQDVARATNSTVRLGIGTTVLGEPITGNEVSTMALLDDFIEFGERAEEITGTKVLPATPDEIRAKVRAMREAQPDWIWEAVAELEEKIRTGAVTVPDVWTEDELNYWRGIFG